jgi:FixJ family two-component response regulator
LALRADSVELAGRAELEGLHARYLGLTVREREVFSLVVTGLLNKQVASRLGTSERTIKTHRSRVLAKMGVGSFAELVVMAEKLRRGRPGPP